MWQRFIYHPEVNYALRQTLVLFLPISIGWLLGNLQYGLLFSLIPACCNNAGLDTPHKRFFKRLIIGGLLFALSSFFIQYISTFNIPMPIILIIMSLLLGVTAEVSPLHARLLPSSLIAAIFTLSITGCIPTWQLPLLYIFGTVWYGIFNYFWFWLWKEQPMRETLSLLYRELADYCQAKYSLITHLTASKTALPSLLKKHQKTIDLINTCYEQIHMLYDNHHYQRLTKAFQVALDLQEQISVSLQQPEEMQKLVEKSHAEAVIRWNAHIIATRLRVLADDILYHRYPNYFFMDKSLRALEKIARQHAENPVGNFCYYHFTRIERVLRTQKPLYSRDLMADRQRYLPLLRAIKSYLSFKSSGLRTAGRYAVMLAFASTLALFFSLPKHYWILITVMFVSLNNYTATWVRIQHRALGTLLGLLIAAATLHLHVSDSWILLIMLVITMVSYLFIRKFYGWATVGFTVTAVYSLQLVALNGIQFLLPRLIDTLMGCLIAFGGTIWLWPQWQSGLLRQNAHDALNAYACALKLLLGHEKNIVKLAYQRMEVNQANNALFNSLHQAMQEPSFNLNYLSEMKLWVTHSQFIVEHINAMTIIAREQHTPLTIKMSKRCLKFCETSLQHCHHRLDNNEKKIESCFLPEELQGDMITIFERHIKGILEHLSVMYTISSFTWIQRPHQKRLLEHYLRKK